MSSKSPVLHKSYKIVDTQHENWANFQAGNAKQIDQIVTQYWPSACLSVSPDTINPHIDGNWELKYPKNVRISKKEIIANATKIDSANAEGRS